MTEEEIIYRRCNICGKPKPLSEFHKDRTYPLGHAYQCKECKSKRAKEYNQRTREARAKQDHEYYLKNKEKIKNKCKEYVENNKEKVRIRKRKYNLSPAKYDIFEERLSKYGEEVRRDPDNPDLLQVRCSEHNCRKWFNPTTIQTNDRLQAIYGSWSGESNFYCSDECKEECIRFNKKWYELLPEYKMSDPEYRAEQEELKKIRLEYADYQCEICGSKKDLVLHHIDPVKCNPIESADVDNCVILCRKCHTEKAHSSPGCRFYDLAMAQYLG